MSYSAIPSNVAVPGPPADRSVEPISMGLNFGGFFRNKIINGDFSIWQRGELFEDPANGDYNADRWLTVFDGTIGSFEISKNFFIENDGDYAIDLGFPFEVKNYLRWNHTAAGSGSTKRELHTRLEDVRTFAGKTIAISFWARADSNRDITIAVSQSFGEGGSASSEVITVGSVLPITSTWTRIETLIEVPSISGKTIDGRDYFALIFQLPINVTMQMDFALVQAEEISCTAFEQRPIALELKLCRRYLRKFWNQQDTLDLQYDMYKEPVETGANPYLYTAELGGS